MSRERLCFSNSWPTGPESPEMKAKSGDEMTRNICEDQAQGLETRLWYKNQVQGSSRRLKSGMMLGKKLKKLGKNFKWWSWMWNGDLQRQCRWQWPCALESGTWLLGTRPEHIVDRPAENLRKWKQKLGTWTEMTTRIFRQSFWNLFFPSTMNTQCERNMQVGRIFRIRLVFHRLCK